MALKYSISNFRILLGIADWQALRTTLSETKGVTNRDHRLWPQQLGPWTWV